MLYRQIILEWGQDTESGVWGLGYSPDNGKNFYVLNTTHGRKYRAEDGNRLYPYISDQIQDKIDTVVAPAKSAADSAVSAADAAVASAQVTSDAVSAIASATAEAKQGASEAMSRAKSAWDVATGAKEAVTEFDPLLKSAQSDASKALTQIADTASALSDAKISFGSDMAAANELANTAQATAEDASGQAVSAVTTANGAMTAAKNAKSDVTVAIQTASGASLVATNAQSDATIAKQTASEATVQASNAESDFAQLSIRANKIEANVANNSGAIANVKQTADGLTTTVANIKANGGGVNLAHNTSNAYVFTGGQIWGSKNIGSLSNDEWVALAGETITIGVTVEWTNWKTSDKNRIGFEIAPAKNGNGYWNNSFGLWCHPDNGSSGKQRLTVTRTINNDIDGVVGGLAYVQGGCDTARIGELMIERGPVAHDWSPSPADLQDKFTQIKTSIDGVTTTINDPKTGLNATYQTAAGNVTTISNVKSDVYQLQATANGLTSRVGNLESKTNTQQTAIEQNKNAIALKADQTAVDTLKGTVSQNTATLNTQANQIQSKVSASDVSGMLTGYATQEYTQSLVTQKADEWNANLTSVKNGLTDSYTNLHATVDGIQAQVYNSDGSSKITQLSSLIATKVSQGDYNSQITQLKNDINLRVAKGDLISQINQEAGGNTLIQVSNGKGSLILDAANTIITGEAWIPSAAISSISADKIMLGSTSLYNSDGTLNLVNQSNDLKALIQVKQGLVQNTTQSIISFASDYNTRAFSITPVGATVTPTLFFERYDQAPDHWLGFTRNEVQREGLEFNTWDNDGERFFVECHARFDRNISAVGTINQGTWNGTTGKPLAGILTITAGNTIWSGSDFLAIGDHVSNGYTNVIAKSFSQQSTLSSKTNIETVDPKDALDLVNRTDIRSYQYKTDVEQGKTKRYTSLIIDDVNDVSKYYAPDEFTNEERTGRDDGSAVGYLFLAVQELTRRIKTLEDKLNG